MRLLALAIALVLAHSTPALAMDDQTAVADTLVAYKKALVDGDGTSASALTSAGSHALLHKSVARALGMNASQLRELSFLDQLSALLLRHKFGTEHLRRMTTDPIEYAVQTRAFDVLKLAKAEVEEIYVEDDEAQAFLFNTSSFPSDAAIFLKKEAGTWRIDLVQYLSQYVPVGVIYNPNTVDGTSDIATEIMSSTITWITGRAPDANIWNPPG